MATKMYAEEHLYPVGKDGKADKSQSPTTFEVYVSNYHGDDQIYLKVVDGSGEEKYFHLTKAQASELSEGLDGANHYIGYDNS
ncbi:hypothetical protein [Pseudomonas aeruginosa]|uniref:hypothetical protein n=1 Tax=Pseudomonas aeruginosa TaxID=287 RepID=UPI001FF1755E|nr:hypothetical protein [Pseudomonas aeruginosa]MCK1183727.1 hypothetical protein [Pseudomonas aeruginosa]HBN9511492.1 hypothetical protein [Pseudomonas aeruginosa]HBN9782227.1 hypothetical protein [Pseudomonas aeruginosa]HBN9851878.1 hypothetical protein [Pseudomonas aeruginosa]HBN9865286.1 hypothetical protein [Pseudomonas aeruginosa]